MQGDFIIISLSGSILLPKDGDTQSTSQLSVSVVGADGNVFGGPVHGRLIAASPMQVFASKSFPFMIHDIMN